MMIQDGNHSIEIVPSERVPDHLPSAKDIRLAIAVRSQGFAGEGWAWVEASRLRQFIEHLRELEIRRSGSAEVESISPGQFWLRLFATDRAGHMAVAGRLAHAEQALEFRFRFCPSLLPGLVAAFSEIDEGRVD
jgi:hypothetical protein